MANDLSLYDRANWWSTSDGFHLLHKMNPGRFRFFDQFLSDWGAKKVLDVGCGGGFTCEFLAKRGSEVSGVDTSEPSLQVAMSHATGQDLSINYILASGTKLPFQDETFDVVTCVDVLEHIPDWRAAVAEIQRVLKPGGFFFFDTINRNQLSRFVMIELLECFLKLIPRGTHDPNLFIKPAEMQDALVSQSFVPLKMTGLGVFWSPFKRDFFACTGGPLIVMYIGSARKK